MRRWRLRVINEEEQWLTQRSLAPLSKNREFKRKEEKTKASHKQTAQIMAIYAVPIFIDNKGLSRCTSKN